MSTFLEEFQQAFANRFSTILASADVMQALSMLRFSGLVGTQAIDAKDSNLAKKISLPHAAECDRVGIWQRKKDTSQFTRNPEMKDSWCKWANVSRIEAKGAKKRVVLIGESVARGYLYDPQFTPAAALQSMLQTQFGKQGIEVIDLACVGVGFSVEELAISALLLKPDITIIFSGNNWSPDDFSAMDIPYFEGALRQDGVPGVKQLAEDRLARRVRLLIRTVAGAYEENDIPLLWIIPEFNLGDWRDPMNNAPYLTDGANKEWIECHERSRAALLVGEIAGASELANRMVELDGGVSVAGFYLLAECSGRQGNLGAARKYLEAARDAPIWDPSIGPLSPRSYSASQDTLREETLHFKNSTVLDLPQFFNEYLKGALPDRRLFLDYCHLTSEGIQVSMAAAASHIIRKLYGKIVTWQELVTQSVAPTREVEAEAAFLAAVHNAHLYQKYDLVHHHCSSALKFAPEVGQVMVKFADVQARGNPLFLSASGERLAEMPWPSIQHYLFHYRHVTQIDNILTDAIGDSLRMTGIGASAQLTQIQKDEQGISVRTANLLDHYYCSAAGQPQENLWVLPGFSTDNQRDYHRAYWLESRFFFVGDALYPASLSVTCRLPNLPSGIVKLALNGRSQYEIPATDKWATWDIVVDASAMVDGINEVTIRWPVPEFSTDDAISRAANDIRHNWSPELYCAFGDVHTFTATVAG
jgi:hypothetical protein